MFPLNFREFLEMKEFPGKTVNINLSVSCKEPVWWRCGGGVTELSDIFDALSDGIYQDSGQLLYGHGGKYYSSIEKRNSEIFANCMSLSVNRPDLIEVLRKDKPNLCKALDEVIAEMAGGIK